ncbi:MAG TPA: type VI secretion system ATPase TssH [Chitinivibrionales bacterium]|nr:type VI secretion system ATPase TssH [Chitinivibrionales bacterium]
MVVKDIRLLLEKLNDQCTKALEASVGLCVNRGHYEVRWEHLFAEFLDDTTGDVAVILKHYNVDAGRLKEAVNTELENLRNGNTGRPSFSPPLLEAMELAWSIGSLSYSLQSITSGLLFVAMLEKGQFSMTSYGELLKSVNLEALKTEFISLTKTSSEQQFSGGDSSGHPPVSRTPEAAASVLAQFCTNFTEEARAGKIDPILGRDDEIRQALDILNRRRKNNPILVGEAGVGKTAIVEGIALRIVNGDVPENLKNVALWGLDLGLLQAGASVKGEFEKRLKNVIDAVKNNSKSTILFIDEAHTLIGAGGAAGQGDAANLLKPALARGELRTLAATTWSEYRKYFEKDPALARRFQLVKIEEPDEIKGIIMLRGVADSFEKYHGVQITTKGVTAAVSLSRRYISGRQLPDKAVDVLDTACARVKMSQSVKPASLDGAERGLQNAELEKRKLERDRKAGLPVEKEFIDECDAAIKRKKEEIGALAEQWGKEKTQVQSIQSLQEKIKTLREKGGNEKDLSAVQKDIGEALKALETLQGDNPMVFPHVSASVCGQVISDWTGIPVGTMVKDEAQTLLELEKRLSERVIGQDDALAALASTIRASKTGMGSPDAPLGVFLFTGPSGVGKTECARALADTLFGGEKFITTINMSEYQEKHTVSQLKGSPPGYVGYGEGGVLTEAVRQKPYSIVLLDEVEKAHLEVMNLFYQVFDKGFMRDGEGREINFRNTIIIMTSNLAADTIAGMCAQERAASCSSDDLVKAIRPELSAHFQPALLARCKIVPFRPLSKEVMKGVVAMKLDTIAQRLKKAHGITMSISPDLVDAIADSCTAIETGARNADAVIDGTLLPGISRQLLLHLGQDKKPATRCHIGKDEDGDYEIVFSDSADAAPEGKKSGKQKARGKG